MRIVHVVPRGEQPWSGILTVIVHLSAALSRQGHEVEVWQLHTWGDAYDEQRQPMGDVGVTQLPVAVDVPWWRLGRAVSRLVDQRRIEIVHLHGAFNVWNTLISRTLRHPYVFSPHSGYNPISLKRSRARKRVYGMLFERAMLRRAALIVALTDVELAQVRAYGARTPAVVIPNGVAPPPDHIDGAAFRTELGLGPATPLAVFVGRLDVHRKGLDVLVRAIAAAPGWHLALVGPRFRDVPRLEALIEELRVTERVHLVGERHGRRLHEAVAGADIFMLTSRWEGLPMSLLEALSYGKPAVVSPGVDELVPIGASGAGWVADEGRLPAVLREAGSEGSRGFRIRREAARRLARRYDWDSVARHYGLAYERARDSGDLVPR
jgi:glycosyltransferase involved in cell wall biosynthesis